ncbi:hypothetical protein GWK47_020916 [Chionoecetes opilio]|uniref:Uncharacterized protein n=1 Tax=Chionoecetes opilio TaxID=41210 RepID=A0A8J4XPK1_CHIOP|nr:hypothetical protein GWK47_020916 [Chionoecetes opilio]
MVKALGQARLEEGTQAIGGKKDDDVFLLLVLRHFEDRSFFQKLDADPGFLAKDPALWEEDDRFKDARKRALGLRVGNDAAERGIALVQRYLGSTKVGPPQEKLSPSS